MLDSILAIIVMVLLYVELCLKSRVGGYLERAEESELKRLYGNIRWQLLLEFGVILLCTIRSFLPEVTTFSCVLILIIVLLTSVTAYRNCRMYGIITEFFQKHKE
nr:hypothetical protein [uncultured Blautia sp.]